MNLLPVFPSHTFSSDSDDTGVRCFPHLGCHTTRLFAVNVSALTLVVVDAVDIVLLLLQYLVIDYSDCHSYYDYDYYCGVVWWMIRMFHI